MTRIDLQALTKTYSAAAKAAVSDLTLTIESGELVGLLGPSGSGKSTALKMIAGLLEPDQGDILFEGVSVLTTPAERRSAVLMFQNHLLFPHLSVGENVGFGLKMRGVKASVIRTRVAELLELVQLAGMEERRSRQLSGGQQQRVALARALILEPRVLLLDEPLSGLDAHLRNELRLLLRRLQRQLAVTTVFVTHDQQEAVMLADRVALLFAGRLQQFAPPHELFAQPASATIANFFGNPNLIPGRRHGALVETGCGALRVQAPSPDGPVTLTIRPERVQIAAHPANNTLCGHVTDCVYTGTHLRLTVQVSADLDLEVLTEATRALEPGSPVYLGLPPEALWPVPNPDPGRVDPLTRFSGVEQALSN